MNFGAATSPLVHLWSRRPGQGRQAHRAAKAMYTYVNIHTHGRMYAARCTCSGHLHQPAGASTCPRPSHQQVRLKHASGPCGAFLSLRAMPMACCLRTTQEKQGTSGAKGCKDNVDVCAHPHTWTHVCSHTYPCGHSLGDRNLFPFQGHVHFEGQGLASQDLPSPQ